jgi:hypothetical protein
MGLAMADYRIYRVDAGGHISEPSKVITCDSDDEAVEKARQLTGAWAVELWAGARFVCRVSPDDNKQDVCGTASPEVG